jgi:RND family efflux transporter MFP subunit
MLRAAGGAKTPAEAVVGLDLQDRIDEAELALDRERRSLTQAEGKRELLRKYTYPKTLRELQSEVKKAHSDELAKQATWELEQTKENKLEKQIANCILKASMNGCVLYANDPSRALRHQAQIEEGATVRERQKILSIVDFNDPMQVNVKVPEALIDQVVPQMKALIRIDAFPNQTFAGLVAEVAPLPDASNSFQSDVKVYTTRIRMGGGRPNLRPGMTATAEIVVDDREEAISVPAKAVARYDGRDHVAVKWPGGRIEWREVVLGPRDGSIVEVKEGLHSGEQVVLEAEPLLTDDQRARRDAVVDPLREKSAPPRKAPVRKAQGKPVRPPR